MSSWGNGRAHLERDRLARDALPKTFDLLEKLPSFLTLFLTADF